MRIVSKGLSDVGRKRDHNEDSFLIDEELSLYYELGCCYQRLGDKAEALYYFERISKRKPRYRDVPRRMMEIAPGSVEDDFGAPANAAGRK